MTTILILAAVFAVSMWGTWYADTHDSTHDADITKLLRESRKKKPERRLM